MQPTPAPTYLRASSLSLEAFADLYSRSFDGYFYPMHQTAEALARRVRSEQIDLYYSPVMQVDGDLAGQATLALRGREAWCGGFGIVPAWRGRGLGPPLFTEFLRWARQAGAARLTLEVLTRNQAALKVYLGCGLTVRRDLLLLKWQRDGSLPAAPAPVWAAPRAADLFAHRARLTPPPACWGRAEVQLRGYAGLQALGLGPLDRPEAYLLFTSDSTAAHLHDLCAPTPDLAAPLIQALQAQFETLKSVNEPDDNPALPALLDLGFVETDRQHEMAGEL